MNSPEKSNLEVQLIIAAVQGLCANGCYNALDEDAAKFVATQAVEIANTILEKLEQTKSAKAS